MSKPDKEYFKIEEVADRWSKVFNDNVTQDDVLHYIIERKLRMSAIIITCGFFREDSRTESYIKIDDVYYLDGDDGRDVAHGFDVKPAEVYRDYECTDALDLMRLDKSVMVNMANARISVESCINFEEKHIKDKPNKKRSRKEGMTESIRKALLVLRIKYSTREPTDNELFDYICLHDPEGIIADYDDNELKFTTSQNKENILTRDKFAGRVQRYKRNYENC